MSNSYQTPGVYIREIPSLPASIAQVPTAIPAFVGFTEVVEDRLGSLKNRARRIGSRVEFERTFGASPALGPDGATVTLAPVGTAVQDVAIDKRFFLYDAIRLFFDNGGGDCYVVSVGRTEDTAPDQGGAVADALLAGLEEVGRHDEPTLLVVPDAMLLAGSDLGRVQQAMLAQCVAQQDRFAVLDIREGEGDTDAERVSAAVDGFRQTIGLTGLKYGAAYTPWLEVAYPTAVRFDQVKLTQGGEDRSFAQLLNGDEPADVRSPLGRLAHTADHIGAIRIRRDEAGNAAKIRNLIVAARSDGDALKALIDHGVTLAGDLQGWAEGADMAFAADLPGETARILPAEVSSVIADGAKAALTALAELAGAAEATEANGGVAAAATDFDEFFEEGAGGDHRWGAPPDAAAPAGLAAAEAAERVRILADAVGQQVMLLGGAVEKVLAAALSLRDADEQALYRNWPLYARMVDAIRARASLAPPSGAIVGCYARVDNDRGVWKAPANVSLAGVVGLTRRIDDKIQGALNVDVDGGKSVNAVRVFRGRGILVWGARTLAGNDNEWRYVPVRRLFNMIEESVEKAMAPLVFEPNDANTWLRVKAMVENYLNGLWRAGALAGPKPDAAYFVNVGLGKTMTPQDILEGRLIVEIGLAAVRPAEFIVLKFSHMMQSA